MARFEIPEVPSGVYQIFHCNDPCTATLGDIIGGWDLRVIDGPEGRPPEDVAADVQARVATAPLLIAAEPSTRETAVDVSSTTTSMSELSVVEPVRVSDRSQVSAGGPGVDRLEEPTAEQAARFDSLWCRWPAWSPCCSWSTSCACRRSGGGHRSRNRGTNRLRRMY